MQFLLSVKYRPSHGIFMERINVALASQGISKNVDCGQTGYQEGDGAKHNAGQNILMADPAAPNMNYPGLYEAADSTSLSAQKQYLTLSWLRLIFLVGTAGVMLLSPVIDSWAAIIAIVFILVALACELLILILHPESQWYDGRAVAESVKTLTWKYQVGGDPFGVDGPTQDADAEFLRRLNDIAADFRNLNLLPAETDQITESMRRLRSRPLPERRAIYREARVKDQREWYTQKSNSNRTRAHIWQTSLVVIEMIALLAAILRLSGHFPIDAYGSLAAMAAAGVGWLQIKQYQNLARAYSVASHELASVNSQIDSVDGEDEWRRFVDHSEDAISREHTLWKASRSI